MNSRVTVMSYRMEQPAKGTDRWSVQEAQDLSPRALSWIVVTLLFGLLYLTALGALAWFGIHGYQNCL